MHIVFAATGTVITFMRFSNQCDTRNSGWFNLPNYILYAFQTRAAILGRSFAWRAYALSSLLLF